jgi:hypothetical protein
MRTVEKSIRRFRAAFWLEPLAANWVRTRARELASRGAAYRIVLVWGERRFHVGNVPREQPYFALELTDGTLERAPWAE